MKTYFYSRTNRSLSARPPRGKAGFTLVEVMVATVLIGMVLAGTFGVLHRGTRFVESARDDTRVTQILQSEIEDLRTLNWANLVSLPAQATLVLNDEFDSAFSTRYTIKRTINARSATQKEIRVRVEWADNGGAAHLREYVTWLTKEGLYDYYYRRL